MSALEKPIPADVREEAAREIDDLIKRMLQAIGSLTRKRVALVAADDLKSQRRVCGAFWRYYDARLPRGRRHDAH